MKILNSLPKKQWSQFVENQSAGNIFHTPEMFEVFSRAYGYHPTLWAAVDSVDNVLALLPSVDISLMDGFFRLLTTRTVMYGSVLYNQSTEGKEALETLLRTYTQKVNRKTLFTELRNLSDLHSIQSLLTECGFKYEDHLNYLINLDRPPEDILQSMGYRTRKLIRRGLKKQAVDVYEITDRSQLLTCYKLLQTSYHLAQTPIADISLFEAAYDVLYPLGMIKFWLACVEGECVAVSVELLYKDVMYGWYGGIDRAYSKYTPGELLMWHILKWGAENGYHIYDFGGAGKPDEEYGVRDFKAKFGGDLVCYGRNQYVHTPLVLQLSSLGYQIYRRFL